MSGMRGVSSIALLGGAAARGARYGRRCRQISSSGLGRPAGAVCRGPPFSRYRLRSLSTSGTKFGARPMA
jgi:hypothetical protein